MTDIVKEVTLECTCGSIQFINYDTTPTCNKCGHVYTRDELRDANQTKVFQVRDEIVSNYMKVVTGKLKDTIKKINRKM